MPDNAFFYYAAYVAAAAIYGGYALSLITRWRVIRRRAPRANP